MSFTYKYFLSLVTFVFCCFYTSEIKAQLSKGYIYGTITTQSGDTFEGFMRWGKEEMYWHDLFNAEKVQSDQYRVNKSKESTGLWSHFDWNLRSIWDNKYSDVSHQFACLFGDIKSLDISRKSRLELEMKNGTKIHLNDGSNDVGATIHLYDYELGKISFNWSKVKHVEFYAAPARATPPFGKPLYGEVETRRQGKFTGYIKWDLDERCGDDILDGDSKYGDQKIPFENIVSIEKDRGGSLVTFASGKEIYVDGSNDVDSGNRGIAVYDHNIGNIEIPWRQFRRVQFKDHNVSGPAYTDFPQPEGLMAEITTYDDDQYEGIMVFDIDEMWEIETLDGNDNDLIYQIPFRNIKRILPKNSSYSMVYLCSGDELLLGESQDVSARNDGILLFTKGKKEPKRFDWDEIDEIIIKE